ncbi:ubiquitin carboxyl-terminal hydrolase 2 [Diplodia corticola]|uniref:Ubiquitin carboxyl-terminal hydrolase 2 n=1 Tax=Diplodia corticola TaxID=236234 RepID=A0A1J9RPR6_9PEZI|nr:ubiquitin carboxyl-terminal hydrolase 2 [Diplodia corticola]OJD34563.1 ubiquitin carboxyl-terminal hydrolase 2 [Diplodia corticola]
MAGPGGGPSRRSHTKSRKGCKTCKKRHIRCDETYPQCRNCTKHQVRCDYNDNPASAAPDSPKGPQQPNLLWTPEIEATINIWQSTGEFPFPELNVYPQPQWRGYSKTDLRLIHHLSSISNEMFRGRTSKLTVWAENMPKFLSIASSYPFVMHSILAFSASHLAWISQSTETRNLAIAHGGIALKGLHEAIGNFSRANSDAVLASSLLLSWQATDWRGWASLMTGIKTIVNAMQPWRHESAFADYIAEQGATVSQSFMNSAGSFVAPDARRDHLSTLQLVHSHIQRLQPYLANYDQECKWLEQLKGYIERLRISNPPQTPEDQFQQLYALRKWLFWVPISLLSARSGDINVLLVLSFFYAAAVAIEPIFPDIGAAFCADNALLPLEEIIRYVNTLQATQGYAQAVQTAAYLMDFPRDTASSYRTRREWSRQQTDDLQIKQDPYGLDTLNLDLETQIQEYGYGQSLSPAFAPSPLHVQAPGIMEARSPYLEVPRSAIDYRPSSAYSSPLGSPAAPPISYAHEDNMFNYGGGMGLGYTGGFVATPTVWT